MTISLPKDLETRLQEEATRLGMNTDDYVTSVLTRTVPPATNAKSLAELFGQMQHEQFTNDPAEIKRRSQEESEFMEAMNRNRSEMEGPNARRLYP
jgi:hypothetical protein